MANFFSSSEEENFELISSWWNKYKYVAIFLLFIVISGILLLTPGFATDLLGFILFLKPTRNFIIKIIQKKLKLTNFSEFNKDH